MAEIRGDEDTDFLVGTSNADLILGGWGGDFIFGYDGDDHISGDAGNDVMAGGEGFDSFVFGPSSGNDLVTDLDPSEDLIIIPRGVDVVEVSYNAFLDAMTVYFDPDGRDTVTFLGATVDDLRFDYAI